MLNPRLWKVSGMCVCVCVCVLEDPGYVTGETLCFDFVVVVCFVVVFLGCPAGDGVGGIDPVRVDVDGGA